MARQLQVLVAGLLLAANAGCLVVAAGAAAAGGAAAGYAYFTAPEIEDFPVPVPDAITATQAALADLQLPVVKQEQTPDGLKIESQTGQKKTILILLTSRPQKLPSDGAITRISVRVGPFGDGDVSPRVLEHIRIRLPGLPSSPPTIVQQTPVSSQGLRPIPASAPAALPGVVLVQTAEPPPAPAPGPTSIVPQPIPPIR